MRMACIGWAIAEGEQFLTAFKHQQMMKQRMTNEILEMLNEKRKLQTADPDRYKNKRSEERRLSVRCKEIEEPKRKHDAFGML